MADTAEPPPQKLSRYRSVRKAQAQQQQQLSTEPPPSIPAVPPIPMNVQAAPPAATVSRSMSRYHRRPNATAAKAPPLRSATVDVPALPIPPPVQDATPARNRALSSPYARAAPNVSPQVPNTSRARAEPVPMPPLNVRPRTARDEAKQLLQDEAERQKRMREKIEAEKRERLQAEQAERERQEELRREAEEAELLRKQEEVQAMEELRRQKEEQERGKRLQKAESAKRQQEREEAERRARLAQVQASPPVSPPRSGGRFGLFGRRRDNSAASQSPPPTARPSQTTSLENRDMDTIRPGGGGAVLGIDAPISAVNAGDRRVSILCNKKTFLLPVTPETTAQDLLRSASTVMTEKIDVHADILVENFAKVSVQRPLRMYEHVRDVMNSWDNDTQNDLEIVNAAYQGHDMEALVASKVRNDKPEGMSCFIYYSSKPGKWNKKYVTLRPDGQLVMAKNENSKDKDQDNICHMSDFDIYRPTERKQKKIKPPKSVCYAVKSQQKSNIFSDESKYVHFFCTSDERTSVKFYNMLQGWRSWHLKHVMGEGQKKPKPQEPKPTNAFLAKTKGHEQGPTSSHTRNASDSSFYQLGSFKPLFDLEEFGKSLDHTAQSSSTPDASLTRMNTRAMHARKMSTRQKAPPPIAYARTGGLVDEIPDMPIVEPTDALTQTSSRTDEETFAAGGLLGRQYTQRQRAVQEREAKSNNGPFTDGPSLIGNVDALLAAQPQSQSQPQTDTSLGRRSSVRSSHRRSSSDIQRSTSTRLKPRPLVDLTPTYKEPPQHRNKGKGFIPESSGALIENATSLEEAIVVPPSVDWRAGAQRPTTARAHGSYGASGHERTRSLRGRGEGLAAYTVNNHAGGVSDDRAAFTGGLLARAGTGQGAQVVGHGVVDGARARAMGKGPLVDLSEGSKFAEGSLLRGVERKMTVRRPAAGAEREKRGSVDFG